MNPAIYATFSELSLSVAQDFLRTAVIVDDRADFGDVGGEAANGEIQGDGGTEKAVALGLRHPTELLDPPAGALAAVQQDAPNRLNAKVIIDAFAKKGIVSSVLKPKGGQDVQAEADPIAAQSDVLVLDWDINKDFGDGVLKLLESLLTADEDHLRLRLVAIYTGDPRLLEIPAQLDKLLEKHYKNHQTQHDGQFTLSKGPIRIVVLAKEDTVFAPGDNDGPEQKTTEAGLPDRIIKEFSNLAGGLVSNFAMASLAAVRDNTFSILTRLHSNLDPAYLWQRALEGDPSEAEDHLIELTSAEVESVLDEKEVRLLAGLDAIKLWINQEVPNNDWRERFGNKQPVKLTDVHLLLEKGLAATNGVFPILGAAPPASVQAFAKNADESDRSNAELAVLMQMKSWYSKPTPTLTLGTVLSSTEGQQTEFWLCIQPRCDSVRLKKATAFPFLQLSENKKWFDIILSDGATGHRRLRTPREQKAKVKPSSIKMLTFTPTAGPETVLPKRTGDCYQFHSADGKEFLWLAELKPNYALSVAHDLATELSRVGLTESRWLHSSGRE